LCANNFFDFNILTLTTQCTKCLANIILSELVRFIFIRQIPNRARTDVHYAFAVLIESNARVAWCEHSRADRRTEPVPPTESVVALVRRSLGRS